MTTKHPIRAVRFGSEPRHFETRAEAIRFCLRRADVNELWRIESCTLVLNEISDFPSLTVWHSRDLSRREVTECHRIAGDNGATIEFRRAPK